MEKNKNFKRSLVKNLFEELFLPIHKKNGTIYIKGYNFKWIANP